MTKRICTVVFSLCGGLGALAGLPVRAAAGDEAARLRVQGQLELLPSGSEKFVADGVQGADATSDTAVAYGIAGMVDYAITPYLAVGVAPRVIFHVATSPSMGNTGEELDLRAHVAGRVPVARDVAIYAALAPGYGHVFGVQDGPSGFALAGALGVAYDVSPHLFVSAEIGYQRLFSNNEIVIPIGGRRFRIEVDDDLSYLHIGLGAGTRF